MENLNDFNKLRDELENSNSCKSFSLNEIVNIMAIMYGKLGAIEDLLSRIHGIDKTISDDVGNSLSVREYLDLMESKHRDIFMMFGKNE